MGPDFQKPTPPAITETIPKKSGQAKELISWWKIYNDPALEQLIKKATAQNLDIRAAGLKILQSRALLGISEGFAYPQVQQLKGKYIGTYKNRYDSFSSLGFNLGWEIDFWGKYARGIESAEASLYASVANYRDLMVLITAEVARNYIVYQTTKERLAYARRNVAIQERIEKITELQYHSGNVSELDMQQARTQLYNTKASLPALELSLRQTLSALALLLGTTPEEVKRIIETKKERNKDGFITYLHTVHNGDIKLDENTSKVAGISYIPLPDFDPHKTIDASLLANRPDIKAAEYLAHAQSAKIGQTKAALYPSFTLFGTIGYSAFDSHSNGVRVSAGPGFSWDIFQYGRLKNQVRFEDAKLQEALVNYSKKVLKAANEVYDALNAYVYTKEQLKQREKALQATVRAFNISVAQYQDGLVSYQRLLSTVEKLTLTQDIYAQTKGLMATDIALLYKALGGGWQQSTPHSYLSKVDLQQMKKRKTDWGKYLDKNATILPKGWR